MDVESSYDISRTADFLRSRVYTRVVLQFPDELLKDAAAVARALRRELGGGARVFVLADTAYNSCCVDEVGASHVDAQCVVHYGHACMSRTSKLPAFFVFGKAPVDVDACGQSLLECSRNTKKHILVLYGLEYAHALEDLRKATAELYKSYSGSFEVQYSEVVCSVMSPSENDSTEKEQPQSNGITSNGDLSQCGDDMPTIVNDCCKKEGSTKKYCLGGLTWNVSVNKKLEDYLLFWIGRENSAFANIVLTFNKCEIVRYDTVSKQLSRDFSHLMKILRRRYYLVEKAKDANIVGILVGTLGVAGYLHTIEQMKDLIKRAGKKSYTLVMGRPNTAKLANFPECEVFVYISCAQTALLDSKEFLAPVITPFEAVLAFSRGKEWTGEYLLDFKDLITSDAPEVVTNTEEARFSFIKGGYVEDTFPLENEETSEISHALAEVTENALSIGNQNSDAVLYQGGAKSAIDYLKARSYQGLTGEYDTPVPDSVLIGRTGRAAGYTDEKTKNTGD